MTEYTPSTDEVERITGEFKAWNKDLLKRVRRLEKRDSIAWLERLLKRARVAERERIIALLEHAKQWLTSPGDGKDAALMRNVIELIAKGETE